jgi:Animal haem peroxidase
MRHGEFPETPGKDQSLPKTTRDTEQLACPFGAYSSLFDADPVPLGKGPKYDSLKKMIEEIAAARASGVDNAPSPADDKATGCDIKSGDENIPAGYTYFGQLVVHDLTHSIMTAMRGGTPVLQNLNTPNLDLDTIYGGGPDRCPHLFQPAQTQAKHPATRKKAQRSDDGARHLFRLGQTAKAALPENWREGYGLPFDLPRVEAGSRDIPAKARVGITARVHDDRNDDNLILAQLTALFLLVHNKVASYLSRNGDPTDNDSDLSNRESFELARHFVLKSYRRIVVHDYLKRLLLPPVYKQLTDGRIKSHDHVPVEFVFGAARVGHAMVRNSYAINEHIKPSVSGLGQMMSFSGDTADPNLPLPADWVIDWDRFLQIDEKIKPQNARRISPFLAPTFVHARLATRPTRLKGSLSFHDLWRCYELGLPTGQQYALQWFGPGSPDRLSEEEMQLTPVFVGLHTSGNLEAALKKHPNFLKNTPLSYYLLQEAAVRGCNGRYLGPLGSYIYAATIMHALEASPDGQSGLTFKDIVDDASINDTVGDTGIKTLPQLLAILDLSDSKLATVIVKTLRRT